jgi:Na+-translocating ferredoxin:NAD+ oxidoreductase RnfD subunit
MANELEEMVSENIEDIGVDAVIERQREQTHSTPRWEGWVALSSSLLAVLSAIAALYATFAADEAAIAESEETVVATYASGAEVSYNVMRAKVDILRALGKAIDPADEAAMQAQARQIQNYRQKSQQFDQAGVYEYKTHDQLTIAVALFQVAILLGGLAVIVQRPALWVFGISFMAGGALFMGYGLLDFFT